MQTPTSSYFNDKQIYFQDNLQRFVEVHPKLKTIIMFNYLITNREHEIKDISILHKNI